MDESLLPCPFCGGEAEIDYQHKCRDLRTAWVHYFITVYCRECKVQISRRQQVAGEAVRDDLLATLVSRWNTRNPETPDDR